MNVNFGERKEFEKHFVEPDAYFGTIVSISDIYSQKGFEEKIVEKLRLEVELEERKVKLPYFLSAVVSHASKQAGYSDSKLYTLLDLAKELDNFKGMWETIKDHEEKEKNLAFVDWLRGKLLSRKLKVMTKTVQSLDGSKYSVVQQVVKFE